MGDGETGQGQDRRGQDRTQRRRNAWGRRPWKGLELLVVLLKNGRRAISVVFHFTSETVDSSLQLSSSSPLSSAVQLMYTVSTEVLTEVP